MYLRCWILGLFVFVAASCKVSFDESMPFYCEDDDDCGGDGYGCVLKPISGSSPFCCKPPDVPKYQSDAKNCGQCGHVCAEGKRCQSGKCV